MNLRSKIVSMVGAAIIAGGLGAPALAQQSDAVDINIRVQESEEGGALTFNVAQTTPFPPVAFRLVDQTVNGGMTWSVQDTRGLSQGWQLNVSATDFRSQQDTNDIIPVGNMSVDAGPVTVVAGANNPLPVANDQMPVTSTPQLFFSAVKGSGNGRYSFTTTTTVLIPGATDMGTYTSTVTADLVSAP
jgi:hypothetical protein